MVWRFHLRDPDQEHCPAKGKLALRHLADIPSVFRSDYDSLSAEIYVSSAAPVRQRGHAVIVQRARHRVLADVEQAVVAYERDGRARAADHLCRGADRLWRTDAGARTAGRSAGAQLPGAGPTCALYRSA